MLRPAALTLGILTAIVGPALAQKAAPEQMGRFGDKPGYGTLHLNTHLGSFKILPGEGRLDASFTGTFLVSGLKGDLTTEGSLTKEYEGMGRTVYHGTGRIVLEGQWRAAQWFGTDLNATWFGSGIIRIIAEFDKDLKTGEYWYNDPDDKGVWPNSLITLPLPEQGVGISPDVKPTKRGSGGN